LLRAGRPEPAKKQLEKCLVLDSGQCDCHLGLGAIALDDGAIQEARRVFAGSVQACPRHPEAHYNLCYAELRLARCKEAVGACQQALALDPGYLEAQHNLAKAAECAAKQDAALGP
jgi:tetratricopeptide (TPR) repeat protein